MRISEVSEPQTYPRVVPIQSIDCSVEVVYLGSWNLMASFCRRRREGKGRGGWDLTVAREGDDLSR